jgi:3-isopropylmalate dehydrogenase
VAKIAVIKGDGIGPDVVDEALKVLSEAAGSEAFEFDALPYSAQHTLDTGITIPEEEFARFQNEYDAIFLGALGDPRIPDMRHGRDILLGARMKLELFINQRPARLLNAEFCPLKGYETGEIDFVIFRENTEGLYVGRGQRLDQGTKSEVATSEMLATYKGTERIIRAAFEYAQSKDRSRVCLAVKDNAIPHAHGLWRDVFNEVAADFSGIEATTLYADVAAMEIVGNPKRFDVIVSSNLLGDVLSDLAAMIVGGLGLAPSANINPNGTSLFEPVHGSAPDIAGQGIANPMAAIVTAAMMADHLGMTTVAQRIEKAVIGSIQAGELTSDLGGDLSTEACGDAVCKRL